MTDARPTIEIVAEHRYRWSVGEALVVLALPAATTAITVLPGPNPTAPVWWTMLASGYLAGGLLAYVNVSRKRSSRLRALLSGDALAVIVGSGPVPSPAPTAVSLSEMDTIAVIDDAGRPALRVAQNDSDGMTRAAVKVPTRLLGASPELRRLVRDAAHARGLELSSAVRSVLAD